jgi:bacterioferritin-associated ferredoxin
LFNYFSSLRHQEIDIESRFQYASFPFARMIVCHCHLVTERRIRQMVREGCSSLTELGRACGAGTSCGGCLPLVCEIVEEAACDRSEREQCPLSLQPSL